MSTVEWPLSFHFPKIGRESEGEECISKEACHCLKTDLQATTVRQKSVGYVSYVNPFRCCLIKGPLSTLGQVDIPHLPFIFCFRVGLQSLHEFYDMLTS